MRTGIVPVGVGIVSKRCVLNVQQITIYKIRSLKCHSIIPMIDYQKVPLFIREINTNCKDHEEKLELYCSAHDTPCSNLCMKEDHHICSGIQPLHAYVENIKESFVYSNLQKKIH